MSEKIYLVKFMTYTNYSKNRVTRPSNDEHESLPQYLDAPNQALIRESDMDYFRLYGDGFESLICVGELMEKPQTIEGEVK